jgi:hypothetical protein
MGIFSSTPKERMILNEDYEKILNKISDVAADIKLLKVEVESLRTNINSINGRINRKLGLQPTEEDLNKPFPFNMGGGLS